MKDLDFDEIDRAVNSVGASTPATDDSSETPVQPISGQPTVPAVPSQTLAGRRSSGQFMDVVHPSSNMRRAPLMMPERAPTQNTIPDNATIEPNTSVPSTESISLTPPPSSDNAWPDPIDFNKSNKDVSESNKDTSQDQNEDSDIDQISDDITNELSQKSEESPDTPFISGTKVDKRPLGAFSNDQTPQTTEQVDKSDSTDKDHVDTDVTPTNTDTSLPDELQDKLLQIESDESSTDPNASIDTPTKVDAPTPLVKSNAPAPVVESQPIAATSITQQYKEQPSTGDQNTGAIYDTDAYHKALVPPAKKKSGWLWVLLIFILVIVGVGAGVVVYKFVLPLL